MQDVDAIVAEAASQFAAIDDLPRLENAKARYLGKQGVLTELLKGLGKLAPEEKRDRGGRINAAKDEIERLLEVRRAGIASARLDARLAEEALDVTLPGRSRGAAASTPSSAPGSGSRRSSARSGSTSPTVRRSRTTGTTSPR